MTSLPAFSSGSQNLGRQNSGRQNSGSQNPAPIVVAQPVSKNAVVPEIAQRIQIARLPDVIPLQPFKPKTEIAYDPISKPSTVIQVEESAFDPALREDETATARNEFHASTSRQSKSDNPESSPTRFLRLSDSTTDSPAEIQSPDENTANGFDLNSGQPKSFPPVPIEATAALAEDQQSKRQDDNSFQINDQSPRVAANPTKTTAAKPGTDSVPAALQGAKKFVLAAQPQIGDHWKNETPIVDSRAWVSEPIKGDFPADPPHPNLPYDPYRQMDIYEGKTLNANQRPILELGRPWYQLGQLSPGYSWFGEHNNITPQFLVYGDVRTAVASNTQNGENVSQVAFEVNLDFDLKLTGTERFHMFMSPVDDGKNTRYLFDDDEFVDEFDADIDFGYFEGDLGAIVGGFTGQTLPFDLPFAVGVMPLVLQNGVWMEDAFLGVAATLPAKNSPRFNISNMDITFFAGYDKINSDAFAGDDSAARMYGMASFIEAMNGYFEIDYAFFDDRTLDDRSYHNIGVGFTRRYGRFLSNSTRVIVNAGQSNDVVENSADGVLLLSENSLITGAPSTLVPYFNMFAGFDRPQSAARAAAAGGVLRNTGILFESDGMTNYPTLDPTANDTFGGALGLNLIADDFSQQLVVEAAMLGVMGENANRNTPGAQYGVGFRYQLPLTNSIIFRTDGMYGFLEDSQDVRGLRFELRRKY